MYNTVIKASHNDQDIDTLCTLFNNSDSILQNALYLAKFGRMSDDGMGMSESHSAYEALTINPSNGFFINEAQGIKHRVLDNGRVRATISYPDGVSGIRDFSLKCSSNSCKITDVFDSNGDSGKQSAERLCR